MATGLIPVFQQKQVIQDYKILQGNYEGASPGFPEASYKVKDLPDLGEVHYDYGKSLNFVSLRVQIDFVAALHNPPVPEDGNDFSFDKTWTRDDLKSISLHGTYKTLSGVSDQFSDPTREGHKIRSVNTDLERSGLIPTFPDEVIKQGQTYYTAIGTTADTWHRTTSPIQVSAKERMDAHNSLDNAWRDPQYLRTDDYPVAPWQPISGTTNEKCNLVFFNEKGYYRETFDKMEVILGVFGPPDTSLFSVSTPGNRLGAGNPRTLGRFQNNLGTSIIIYGSNLQGPPNFSQVYIVAGRLEINDLVWKIEPGNPLVITTTGLIAGGVWPGQGTVSATITYTREAAP